MTSRPRRLLRRLHEISAQITGTTVGVYTTEPVVALTFDDGPDPRWTPALLEILARHKALATFFVLGKPAACASPLMKRIVDAGHALGNHSWDHPSMPLLTWRGQRAQLRWTNDVLATYERTRLFRPPYGHQTLRSHLCTALSGYNVVGWDCAAGDWRDDPAEAMVERIERQLQPGSIVLFHDRLYTTNAHRYEDRSETLRAVDLLISKHPDVRFVTVPTLLRLGRARRRHEYAPPDLEWLRQLV